MPDLDTIELKMDHSKYSFKYSKGEEYKARIFRYDEDITDEMSNNLVMDLFYEIIELRSRNAELEGSLNAVYSEIDDIKDLIRKTISVSKGEEVDGV